MASTSTSASTTAGSSGAAGGGAATPISTPSTPQPSGVSGGPSNNGNGNNNNNNNHNNSTLVSPSGNNNLMTPVQAFTPTGQPVYNPPVYMSAHGGHPHAGAHYPAMIPAPMPSNHVYVNNVTANVNLHGWPHGVPAYMPPGGQHHYIGHGDMPQDQGNTVMPHLQPVPINLAPQGGSPNPHVPRMGGGRTRERGRPRGGGQRRNDYHGPRHLQQQQHLINLPPQQQLPPPDGANPGLQLQPDQMGQQLAPPEAHMQHLQQYYAAAPPTYAYGPYPSPYFTPQHANLQPPPNATAAQQATGTPLFISGPVMYNPAWFNHGGYIYPMMHPAEYQYVPEDAGQPGVDERGAQPDGGMTQIWHQGPMYAEDFEVLQQQQQQQQVAVHPNGGAVSVADELNHNSSSLPSSETSSMLSPNYPIYDPQMHEMQHQMGVMQIYDDGQLAALQPIHPGAGPLPQYEDELGECGAPPPGAIPVAWTAAMPLPPDGVQPALLPPPHHILQQTSPVLIEQPAQLVQAQPPQPPTPTPQQQQQQPQQEQAVDKSLTKNNNEVVALDEKLANEKQQQIELEFHQQQQQQEQLQQQVRRKYSSEYNHHHHQHGSSDTGIQTTKTMSWTNSAQHKKSTQSVSVTASPNNVNNGPAVGAASAPAGKTNYGHTTKTFTNQQHYQQQHYHTQNTYNNNSSNSGGGSSSNSSSSSSNNQPQVRNYGTMKVPSSPVASTAPTLERKNSQQAAAAPSAATAAATPVAIATATTSTASITATPNQFQPETGNSSASPAAAAPQQQQPAAQQHVPAAQAAAAAAAPSKSYSNYASKKHQSYEPAVLSSVVATSSSANAQPQLNLAPPAPPASQNSSDSSQLSWASLFASNKPVAKVAPYEASKIAQQQQPPHPVLQLAPPQPAQVAAAAPVAQLASPPQNVPLPTAHQQSQLPAPVPAPTAPLVTPGTLSYSAASAQAVPAPSPASASVKPLKPEPARPVQQHLDEWTNKYAEYLTRHKTNLAPISLRPRGLTNRSNYCYINSILQALLGCSPFYNLLRSIPKQAAVLSEVKTPTVNAMMSFMTNFSSLPSGLRLRLNNLNKGPQSKGKDEFVGSDLQCDMAFEPTEIYKLWNDSREEHVEGRQEDAEEFLGYVLNKLNDEMLEVIKLIDKPTPQQNGQEPAEPEDGGDVWQMICNNRNKGSVTRQTDFGRTPVSDIFRGELRSRLQREGEHSTDVIQPFFTLQLNIEKAASVKEALEILVGRDQLEGVTGSKTKQEVVAWQQMTLEKLPVVLILHLKYFDYRSDGCTKILKKVEFPVELKIDAKILGSKKTSQKQRAYRLFAVVYHDGKEASKGHYITDVFHTGYSSWLRYDDSSVKPVSEKHVLQPHTPRVPYLLYYRRSDTLPPQQQQTQQQNGGGSGGVVGSSSSSSNAGDNK
ncbi:uncharacterized protein Dere_GG14744 [Drosophila erecta]|uniref:ubiquitinyl hydrolase 1 n=1 Tax=Drosophila erecta TaxID=7220 RepID=B3NJD1_DROER|nr:uncharacterized protein Dere_GG14744 [Drosophila erecta]